MKQFLIYLKYNFAAALLMMHSLAAIPIQLNALAINVQTENQISTETDIGEEEDLDEDEEDEDLEESEIYDFGTDLIIYALNPGYTVTAENGEKLTNVGEFIELINLSGDEMELTGYSLRYTNTSNNSYTIYAFPEGSYMTGERLLLRYAKAGDGLPADSTYAKELALGAGPLELLYGDEVVDMVCWTGKTGCKEKFVSTKPTTLVRSLWKGEFAHLSATEYLPEFDEVNPSLHLPAMETEDSTDPDGEQSEAEYIEPRCRGLEFSEILTYYADSQAEQFIEFYNATSGEIDLSYCKVLFKNKLYALEGIVPPAGYLAYYPGAQFSLTKNPTNALALTIIDANGEPVDEILYGNGQKKTTSYARIFVGDEAEWRLTYAITPSAENIYQQFKTCEEGKIINEATGNCVKSTSLTLASSILADCPEGKYRNPLTNRCKNIETASTLADCAEGYERNPETNRCRKVASTSGNDGADYALVPKTRSDNTVFIGVGIVSMIVAIGGVYVVLQFRHEIVRASRKVRQRCNDICQNLLARRRGRDGDKKT